MHIREYITSSLYNLISPKVVPPPFSIEEHLFCWFYIPLPRSQEPANRKPTTSTSRGLFAADRRRTVKAMHPSYEPCPTVPRRSRQLLAPLTRTVAFHRDFWCAYVTTCALTAATIATRKSLRPIALSLRIIEKMDGMDKRCNE